nr:PREDICTED: UDP-GlcNAc:betaGal beta-1,3-N-acetylglucosaminyltransferase 9 [Lepisosteus oculatus]
MKVRLKGDVICTVFLLLLFGIVLYSQFDFTATWGIWHPAKTMPSSRALLGSLAEGQTAGQASPPLPDRLECQPAAEEERSTGPTGPVLLTRPPFDFQLYLRNKDCRDFQLLLNQPGKCSGHPFLLIAVKTLADEFDKRQVVRHTWGKEGVLGGAVVRTVFLLGVPKNRTALPLWERLLQYESRAFRDILLWDFADTFFNLTLKEIHFLKWVDAFCPSVKFIFKGDADVYVNVDNIVELLRDTEATQDVFIGDIIYHAQPIRSKTSKYFIPEIIYGQGVYPAYAGGGGFVMSGFTARRLYRACKEVELFPIDDVFMGMCLLRIGLKPEPHRGFRTFGIVKPSAAPHLQVFDPCFYRDLMVVHSLTVPQIWLMWNLLHDPELQCSARVAPNRPFRWQRKMRTPRPGGST